ncbi:MAG: acetyl-CoA hydrolase/transferase C-terminal domain-containing protein [Bradymonadaceae bacterium]
MTTHYDHLQRLVDDIVDRLGPEITVATPLGLGKANHIINELVDRAVDDPDLELSIWTALSLTKPSPSSELERRLVEPLADRLFGDYPDPTYVQLLHDGELPDNIEIHEFYYPPGEYLDVPRAQQSYHSVNYTHVLREIRKAGVDLVAQMVGVGELDGELHYNLSSNTDLSADLIPQLIERREQGGEDAMIVGQVNHQLPFMFGDAPVHHEQFDAVLDAPDYEYPPFAPPNLAVDLADHLIGLRVSSLIRDGGTLQIGIGSLGDAIAWSAEMRHEQNDQYRDLLERFDIAADGADLIDDIGGLAPFDEGLYGGTEMFVEAFLHLIDSGIVDREVYDDVAIQRLVAEGRLDGPFELAHLEALVDEGAVATELGAEDVDYLTTWGLFRDEVTFADGELTVDGETFAADLDDPDARSAIAEYALGDELEGGNYLHAGFFLGPRSFYEALREMDEAKRRKVGMRSVAFTNQLYHHEELNRLQRRDARFVNTGMKATVSGAVVSDGLEDNRVVSGVGGQFNFVNMAHELDEGRSIIMVRATRTSRGEVESNIVFNYGHITIPRHLRDIVVTEYGAADLRGKSDAEVAAALVEIADARFQSDLVAEAKDAGKLPDDYEIPEAARHNTPEALEQARGDIDDELLPTFPYGTDLTDAEVSLTRALRGLKERFEGRGLPKLDDLDSIPKTVFVPDEAEPYLERMDLADPPTTREHALRRLVVFALAEADIV